MSDKNRNLFVRIVSAAVLLPVVIWLLVLGGDWAAALFAICAAVCAGEYYAITRSGLGPAQWVGMVAAAILPFYAALWPGQMAEIAFWTVALVFFFGWIYHLLKGPLTEAPTRTSHLITGMLYAGIGTFSLAALRLRPDGLKWVFCALIITWGNDTCAYFAGRFLGRHKLYPAVSPNKTWEGFAGGMAGSILGMLIAKWSFFPVLSLADCFIVGVAGGIFGPLGDLCESMLKRAYGVKDSGKAIPGHGGVLDRVDALLFNAPAVFLYVVFLGRAL